MPFSSLDEAKKIYEVLGKHKDVKELDTARVYKDSEKWIGELGLTKKYRITTKAPTFMGSMGSKESDNVFMEAGIRSSSGQKEKILEAANQSFKLLGVDKVFVYLLHAPDTRTPFEEQMEAVQELYLKGRFQKFGISNFTVPQVKEIHRIATEKDFVLPTVYQGSYSLLFRNVESDLFPTLRSLNIAFQAYSPIGGGFLVKTPEFIADPPEGSRWDPKTHVGKLYQSTYNKPGLIEYLKQYTELAKETGLDQAEIAYRWAKFHGILDGKRGDTVIIGSGKPAQLEETLTMMEKGPLDDKVVQKLDMMWEKVKDAAPHHDYMLKFLS